MLYWHKATPPFFTAKGKVPSERDSTRESQRERTDTLCRPVYIHFHLPCLTLPFVFLLPFQTYCVSISPCEVSTLCEF